MERAAGRHGLSRFELESQRFRHAAFTLLSTSPLALASRPRIGRVRGCWRLNGFVEAIEAVEAVEAVGADGSGWKRMEALVIAPAALRKHGVYLRLGGNMSDDGRAELT